MRPTKYRNTAAKPFSRRGDLSFASSRRGDTSTDLPDYDELNNLYNDEDEQDVQRLVSDRRFKRQG